MLLSMAWSADSIWLLTFSSAFWSLAAAWIDCVMLSDWALDDPRTVPVPTDF